MPEKERSAFRSLATLAAANALPIAGVAWFLLAQKKGEAKLAALPPGSMERIALLGAVLAAIVFLAWAVYPAVAFALGRIRAVKRARREALREAGFLGKVTNGIALAAASALAAFLWLDVLVLAATVLVLACAEAWILIELASSFSAQGQELR
ncbi:hypothetical protein HY251_16975 [bacterium]|nr:hypothetical protein [bacterium]